MDRFTAVIHSEPDGGYWAEVPALPGCYSQGETVAEVLERLREAVLLTLEVMRERGTSPEADVFVAEVAV